jgi:uncharacterized Ntn-hydrolase superfamily protein
MTWSIVARDTQGALGVAVASRFFAVGALSPYARSAVGALATQALVNPGYGTAGLDRLVDTADAFRRHAHLAFAERLPLAMEAGEAAGGDKRGKQAAALRIVTTEDYPMLDLRVDDHVEPLAELRRLYGVSLQRFQAFVACLPSRARPAGITDRPTIEREVECFRARRADATREAARER